MLRIDLKIIFSKVVVDKYFLLILHWEWKLLSDITVSICEEFS